MMICSEMVTGIVFPTSVVFINRKVLESYTQYRRWECQIGHQVVRFFDQQLWVRHCISSQVVKIHHRRIIECIRGSPKILYCFTYPFTIVDAFHGRPQKTRNLSRLSSGEASTTKRSRQGRPAAPGTCCDRAGSAARVDAVDATECAAASAESAKHRSCTWNNFSGAGSTQLWLGFVEWRAGSPAGGAQEAHGEFAETVDEKTLQGGKQNDGGIQKRKEGHHRGWGNPNNDTWTELQRQRSRSRSTHVLCMDFGKEDRQGISRKYLMCGVLFVPHIFVWGSCFWLPACLSSCLLPPPPTPHLQHTTYSHTTYSHTTYSHNLHTTCSGSGGALGSRLAPLSPRLFVWQAWHLATWTSTLRGRCGTWRHQRAFCVTCMLKQLANKAGVKQEVQRNPRHDWSESALYFQNIFAQTFDFRLYCSVDINHAAKQINSVFVAVAMVSDLAVPRHTVSV